MHRDLGLHLVRLVGSWLLGVLALHPMTAGAQNATAPAVVVTQQTIAQGQAENTVVTYLIACERGPEVDGFFAEPRVGGPKFARQLDDGESTPSVRNARNAHFLEGRKPYCKKPG
jgi:hypothetical protein